MLLGQSALKKDEVDLAADKVMRTVFWDQRNMYNPHQLPSTGEIYPMVNFTPTYWRSTTI